MQSLSKCWALIQLLCVVLVIFRANDVISGLNFPEQDILKLDVLVRVVVEEAPGVYQAEEHLWQVVLECDGSLLSCCAVRGGSFFCLPYCSFTRVDEATLP